MNYFERDIIELVERLSEKFDSNVVEGLYRLADRLIELNKNGLVKINHSAMELVCAAYLLDLDFRVEVEHRLSDILICDLYATGNGVLVVEVETGFVPPENALDPITYCRARIASKVARYSPYGDKFALATPPYYILQIPKVFLKGERWLEDALNVKDICDKYYRNPPITVAQLLNASLDYIFVIDVDEALVLEYSPEDYVNRFGGTWNPKSN